MIELTEEQIARAMYREIKFYLWEVWLDDRYTDHHSHAEHYLNKILSLNEACKAFGIPAQIVLDYEGCVANPYAIEISGKKKNVFSRIREEFEATISDPDNIYDKLNTRKGE